MFTGGAADRVKDIQELATGVSAVDVRLFGCGSDQSLEGTIDNMRRFRDAVLGETLIAEGLGRSQLPRRGRPSPPLLFASVSVSAFSACSEDCLPLSGFRRFSLRLLGKPSCFGLFPCLTFRLAGCGFGSLPGGQLGRLALFRCSSRRLALGNPTVTVRDCLLTNL